MIDEAPKPPVPRTRHGARARFTIRGLMVGCFYAAFALAAVLRPSTLAANFLRVAFLCLLVAAAGLAIAGRGAWRAACLGFATIGFVYLAQAELSRDGSPTLMATSRLIYQLVPGELPLQDYPAFFASCAVLENAAYAAIGGLTASLLALVLRRRSRVDPVADRPPE